jgi:hypothetical protein
MFQEDRAAEREFLKELNSPDPEFPGNDLMFMLGPNMGDNNIVSRRFHCKGIAESEPLAASSMFPDSSGQTGNLFIKLCTSMVQSTGAKKLRFPLPDHSDADGGIPDSELQGARSDLSDQVPGYMKRALQEVGSGQGRRRLRQKCKVPS